VQWEAAAVAEGAGVAPREQLEAREEGDVSAAAVSGEPRCACMHACMQGARSWNR
jgi:hypothetical protein